VRAATRCNDCTHTIGDSKLLYEDCAFRENIYDPRGMQIEVWVAQVVGYTHAEILPRNRVDRRRDGVDNDFDEDAWGARARGISRRTVLGT